MRVTIAPRGWAVAVLAGVAVGVGWRMNETAFAQIGLFALVILGAAYPFARWNVQGLRLRRQLPRAAFVGDPTPVTSVLENGRRWWPAWHLELIDGLLGPFGEGFACRALKPGARAESTFDVRLRERGVNPVFKVRATSSFPGGLWEASVTWKVPTEVTIYPRPLAPANLDDPKAQDIALAEETWRPRPDFEGDYLGIRDFSSGDPLKMVHWRATARAQRLVVREFDQRLPVRYSIFFHSFTPKGSPAFSDAFDAALEMLCGLLLHCREMSVPLEVTADFFDWRTLVLSESRDLSEPLGLLATAQRRATRDLELLAQKMAAVPAGGRIFVLSDTAVRHWEAMVPEAASEVVCLSVVDMRRRHGWNQQLAIR